MQTLLINPRRRKARKAGASRKRRTAAQRAATKRMIAANRAGRTSNPAPRRRRVSRKRNPIMSYSRARRASPRMARRRRNPISMRGGSLTSLRTYMGPIKDAAAMGVGAVLIDALFGYVNRYLPAAVKRVPGQVGLGDAVKAIITIALGQLLSGPTRGYSRKAAVGSLVVQTRDLAMAFMPAAIAGGPVGYVNAGVVVPNMTGRVNANMAQRGGMGAYTGAGRSASPLLAGSGGMGGVGAYTGGPMQSPLLARAPARRV